MDNQFDINTFGKRLPYKTPDGFFDELEANVWDEVKTDLNALSGNQCSSCSIGLKPKYGKKRLSIFVGTLSMAASIAVAFIVCMSQRTVSKQSSDGLALVEKAYSNLCPEDQEYMLQVYQEDVFINE